MKLIRAKDIHFEAKSKRAKTPVEYENMVIEVCESQGWIYKGIIDGWNKTAQNTRVLILAGGQEFKPMIGAVILGRFKGVGFTTPPKKQFARTEEEHLKVAQEFYDKHGFDVLGCAEPYKGVDTRLILRCRCHGHITYKSNLHTSRRFGGLICEIVRGSIIAIQNGYKKLLNNDDIQRPTHVYICFVGDKHIKYGITTKSDPMTRIKEHARVNKGTTITAHKFYTFDNAWKAADLELGIKLNIRGRKISRSVMPYGFTETLPMKKLEEVQNFIDDYISKNHTEPQYLREEIEEWLELGKDFNLTEEEIDRVFEEMKHYQDSDDNHEELDLEPLDAI
ncbi:hypothetical protein J8P63_003379 [Salmonella enterica]|nr:hypothetical protein [Salmonella enterica]